MCMNVLKINAQHSILLVKKMSDSMDNCCQTVCMSTFSILLKSSRQAIPVTLSFLPTEGRIACRRPEFVEILVVDRFF